MLDGVFFLCCPTYVTIFKQDATTKLTLQWKLSTVDALRVIFVKICTEQTLFSENYYFIFIIEKLRNTI